MSNTSKSGSSGRGVHQSCDPVKRKFKTANGFTSGASFMPELNVRPRSTVRVRYEGSTSTSSPIEITRGDLLDFLQTVSASTTAVRIAESVRLTHMKVYAFAPSTQALNNVAITWNTERGPDFKNSVTAANAVPGFMNLRPPSFSLANYWSTYNVDEDEVLFSYEYDDGFMYIDLTLQFVMFDGGGKAGTVTNSQSTGVYRSVLPILGGSSYLQPVDVESVIFT